ncbi:MAG: LPS assembly lipoprotein LptE [Alphaproteobacteria bacterium]
MIAPTGKVRDPALTRRHVLAAAIAVPLLAACGFQPLYGARGGVPVAQQMATIKISVIGDRAGQQLRNFLLDRINPRGEPPRPLYRLDVSFGVTEQALAIRKDETTTRSNLLLAARFRLYGSQGAEPLFEDTVSIAVSYDEVESEFASRAAALQALETGSQDVADEITTRLAAFFAGLG